MRAQKTHILQVLQVEASTMSLSECESCLHWFTQGGHTLSYPKCAKVAAATPSSRLGCDPFKEMSGRF